jgi:hypothetical protein
MFARYAVLFVGYSHRDPVMNYLARGLSPSARRPRYAFTTPDYTSLDSWKFLGVHELVYPVTTRENAHEAITNCVRDWCAELHCGLLEKAERIRAISESQPPLEGEDADYLRFCLATTETARIFFRYASHPEWISWLEKNGFLVSFFDSKRAFGDFERELGFLVHRQILRGSRARCTRGDTTKAGYTPNGLGEFGNGSYVGSMTRISMRFFPSGWLCFYCNLMTY